MNDETRKALMEVIEAELDSYCPSPFNGAFAVSLMQIIDRLITTRPEPLCRCGHPKFDHYKYILNGAETWSCKSCDPTSGLAGDQELSGDAWEQRMAADHPYEPTRPDPAADAIERAAKAMWDDVHVSSGRSWEDAEFDQDIYRSMARGALQAAGAEPEPDAGWLDETLNSVHPDAWIDRIGTPIGDRSGKWQATVVTPIGVWEGTGATRREAVLNAVAKAKEAR